MQIRKAPGEPLILEASTFNGLITITDGSNGEATIAIPAANFAAIPQGVYEYDLFRTDTNVPKKSLRGKCRFDTSITEDPSQP